MSLSCSDLGERWWAIRMVPAEVVRSGHVQDIDGEVRWNVPLFFLNIPLLLRSNNNYIRVFLELTVDL